MNTVTPSISNRMTEISPVDALWVLIQSQTKTVRKALTKRLLEEDSAVRAQQKMVKKSLTKAFEELHAGLVKHDARNLFAEWQYTYHESHLRLSSRIWKAGKRPCKEIQVFQIRLQHVFGRVGGESSLPRWTRAEINYQVFGRIKRTIRHKRPVQMTFMKWP